MRGALHVLYQEGKAAEAREVPLFQSIFQQNTLFHLVITAYFGAVGFLVNCIAILQSGLRQHQRETLKKLKYIYICGLHCILVGSAVLT